MSARSGSLFYRLSKGRVWWSIVPLLVAALVGCGIQAPLAPAAPAAPVIPKAESAPDMTDMTDMTDMAALLAVAAALPTLSKTSNYDAPPPLLGIMVGENATMAHATLVHAAYQQTRWVSKPPVLVRSYEAGSPTPLRLVELETCPATDAVIGVRVAGNDARAVYEAAHHKFDFRFVDRARDVPGMDPGSGPDMPFSKRYAENVVLTLTTTPDGAELRLENTPLRQQCVESFDKARQHMEHYFLEQSQVRAERARDSL